MKRKILAGLLAALVVGGAAAGWFREDWPE